MKEHPHTEFEEDRLDPLHGSWQERREQASEHPPTGAPKESLLRTLAEEALAKGNPVLVIPLDTSTAEDSTEASEEPEHDLRLPKNTTVIFSGKDSLPAISYGDPRAKAKVIEKSSDLGEEARKGNCFSVSTSSATPVRIVDPVDPDSQRWRSLEAGGKLLTPHSVIFASAGEGKVHSQGKRKAEKKRLSFDDAGHLNTANPREESQ